MYQRKILYLIFLLTLVSSNLFANDIMFSEATLRYVLCVFCLWLVSGFMLRYFYRDLKMLGKGAIIISIIFVAICMHVEFAMMFWMIYLAIVTVYYFSARKKVKLWERKINILFHGSFLFLVIILGIIGKYLYYSRMGGYARWAATMREFYGGWLFLLILLLIVEFTYFYKEEYFMEKKIKHENKS